MNKEATKEELAEQVQRLQQNLAVADKHNVELVHERNRMAEEMKTKDKQLQAKMMLLEEFLAKVKKETGCKIGYQALLKSIAIRHFVVRSLTRRHCKSVQTDMLVLLREMQEATERIQASNHLATEAKKSFLRSRRQLQAFFSPGARNRYQSTSTYLRSVREQLDVLKHEYVTLSGAVKGLEQKCYAFVESNSDFKTESMAQKEQIRQLREENVRLQGVCSETEENYKNLHDTAVTIETHRDHLKVQLSNEKKDHLRTALRFRMKETKTALKSQQEAKSKPQHVTPAAYSEPTGARLKSPSKNLPSSKQNVKGFLAFGKSPMKSSLKKESQGIAKDKHLKPVPTDFSPSRQDPEYAKRHEDTLVRLKMQHVERQRRVRTTSRRRDRRDVEKKDGHLGRTAPMKIVSRDGALQFEEAKDFESENPYLLPAKGFTPSKCNRCGKSVGLKCLEKLCEKKSWDLPGSRQVYSLEVKLGVTGQAQSPPTKSRTQRRNPKKHALMRPVTVGGPRIYFNP